jgi:signal transduction histidine kinase
MTATLPRAIRFKPGETLKSRLWPVLILGFGTLLVLVVFSGVAALGRARQAYAAIARLYDAQQRTEQSLTRLRASVQSSALTVRDFLLDPAAPVGDFRRELVKSQQSAAAELSQLRSLVAPEDGARVAGLAQDVDAYWQAIDPLFTWSAAQKARLSPEFLKRDVIPRRQAVLALVSEIQNLTYVTVNKRRAEIESRLAALPFYAGVLIVPTVIVALIVAVLTVFRIFELERIASERSRDMEAAEREMRDLSRQLVRTQEEERRLLSRELHDQIGQTLTAVRINLGNLEEALADDGDNVRYTIDQSKRLAEQALRSVRDIAMGLRPAMLDDLGLEAALQWQARQHSRVCGVPVTVSVEGALTGLSDAHRTCIYRIVQEALNNAAKHAEAHDIAVSVRCDERSVSISVHDNGRGFDMFTTSGGLGLIGMKERVRQLDGEILIVSEPGQGTDLIADIPLAIERG